MLMGTKAAINRTRIVEAANQLFYQRGYNQTSFSDIAEASGLHRGNFYYYFKTKEDILGAVIDYRMAGIRQMLADWEREFDTPLARLKRFVQMLRNSAADIRRYGCPIGSLNVELSKTQLQLQSQAIEMFELFRPWLAAQFQALGHTADADRLALHMLSVAQGISLISNVYKQPDFLDRETVALDEWLDGM